MDTWSGTTTGTGILSQPSQYAMASHSLALRLGDGTATIPILTLIGTRFFRISVKKRNLGNNSDLFSTVCKATCCLEDFILRRLENLTKYSALRQCGLCACIFFFSWWTN